VGAQAIFAITDVQRPGMSAPKSATAAERRRIEEHQTLVTPAPTELCLQRYCANTNVGAVNVGDEDRAHSSSTTV
jgi:hypothetical protein